jgi:hypothetical protein
LDNQVIDLNQGTITQLPNYLIIKHD